MRWFRWWSMWCWALPVITQWPTASIWLVFITGVWVTIIWIAHSYILILWKILLMRIMRWFRGRSIFCRKLTCSTCSIRRPISRGTWIASLRLFFTIGIWITHSYVLILWKGLFMRIMRWFRRLTMWFWVLSDCTITHRFTNWGALIWFIYAVWSSVTTFWIAHFYFLII